MGDFFRKTAAALGRHRRKLVQLGWGLLSNAYVKGFLPGGPNLYEGGLKRVCVPGLNCYSCPGALGSCPVGALQNALCVLQHFVPAENEHDQQSPHPAVAVGERMDRLELVM